LAQAQGFAAEGSAQSSMKMIPLLLLTVAQGYSLAQGVTPVQKVIQMLQEMSAKGQAEKSKEAEVFAKYNSFCISTTKVKAAAIKKATEDIALLQADIQKAMSDVAVATRKIGKLDATIGELEASAAKAKAVREEEHETYLKTHGDATATVDSIQRGIQAMQGGQMPSMLQAKQKAALAQVSKLAKLPVKAKRVLVSFLSQKSEFTPPEEEKANALAVSAPEAAAYEFQSGGLIDMMKKLEYKFVQEKHEIEKEEMKVQAAYDMVATDLANEIQGHTDTRNAEAATKSAREQAAAESKAELEDTQKSKAADEKYLATLSAECEMASSDFESRQQLRDEEMAAIAKAVEIMSGGSVSGAADKHLPALTQTQALSLLRSKPESKLSRKKVAGFLQSRAAKVGSKLLSMVAQKVGSDPIEDVKKMMKDMIVQLMEQATEESDHKAWCDKELASNKMTRDKKSEGVAALTTQKDKLNADIAKLQEGIAELTRNIAQIDAAVAQATIDRSEEAAKNEETIADAKEAQKAVSQALAVLKDFYRKAATATALAQTEANAEALEEPPSSPFKKSYNGMGASSGGVVGMLEVIASDFARLEADTETSESQSSTEFERFSAESAKDKAVKSQDMFTKEKTQASKKVALTDTVGDLKATQGELDSALVYFEKLKPDCVTVKSDYEERVARREAEIQGLEESLAFFNGQDLPPMGLF